MKGLIGKKVGMTSVFDELGRSIAVTVIEIDPCVITQIKTEETDGYNAVQIAAFDRKEKNISKALVGHLKKAGSGAKHQVKEIRNYIPEGMQLGDILKAEDVFQVGDIVDVVGTSKGRGFSGVIRRHNFSGVGGRTHGQHNRDRAPGSIGQASDPSRVFKGMRMAGRYGNEAVKLKNLSIAGIYPDSNTVLVTGAVPGPNGGYLEITSKS